MLKAAFAIGFLKDQLSQMRAAPETAMILVELVRGPTTYLGYWLAKKGYRFAVAPQNMEFLVPSKASRGEMDVWQYRMERSIYRAASCVLCISDFDAKIVRCLSARAVTLPYYPWKGDALRCSKIKKGRLNVSGSFKLLYVGTVNNEPSYLGLERLLAEFDHSLDSRWTLHVVGYGTARLSSAASRRAIIEGAVTDARLDEMLQECRAVLLHQPATTGFMTRLVELNLSGVPVFVNEEYSPAAGLERFGVRIYRELHEVVSLLDEPELEAFEEIKAPDTPVGRDLRSFVLEASAVK